MELTSIEKYIIQFSFSPDGDGEQNKINCYNLAKNILEKFFNLYILPKYDKNWRLDPQKRHNEAKKFIEKYLDKIENYVENQDQLYFVLTKKNGLYFNIHLLINGNILFPDRNTPLIPFLRFQRLPFSRDLDFEIFILKRQ